jgi:hypothetical protein
MTHLLLSKLPYDVVQYIGQYTDKDGIKQWLKDEFKKYTDELDKFKLDGTSDIIYISSQIDTIDYIPSYTSVYRPSLYTRIYRLEQYRDYFSTLGFCLCPMEERLSTISSLLYARESIHNLMAVGNRYSMTRVLRKKFLSMIKERDYILANKFYNIIEWRMSFLLAVDVPKIFYRFWRLMIDDPQWETYSIARRKKPFLKKKSFSV